MSFWHPPPILAYQRHRFGLLQGGNKILPHSHGPPDAVGPHVLVSHPRSKDLKDLVLYFNSETVEIEAQESPASAQNVASKPAVILL